MSAQALLTDLGLDGPMTFGPGRRALPLRVAYAGELTVEDLIAAKSSALVQQAVPVKALRQSHHVLARVLAQGLSNVEVGAITGYDPQRIGVLKSDPAFAELLAYYRQMEAQQYSVARADMHGRLATLGFDAVETLHQKLLDEPDSFDPKTLLAVVEAISDRTGFGKTSTVQHDHAHSLSDDTIAKIKGSSVADRAVVSEADRESLLRLATRGTAGELSEEPEADWSPVAGSEVREAGEAVAGEEVEH